jgi:tyrosine phenol-lyase
MFKTIIEPFKIKSVEAIEFTRPDQRRTLLDQAGLNPFLIPSQKVMIDLLTDSGTTAMSSEQWAGLMRGDESYAGSPSFVRFESALQTITGLPYIIPTHQGRASERILFSVIGRPGQLVVSNMLFDTTRANAEAADLQVVDLPCPELATPMEAAPFKGNVDLKRLKAICEERSADIACFVMTITNNSGGGQPASLENMQAAAALCKKHKILFVIDGCRFAENAWFIKSRETRYESQTPLEITQQTFALADVISISAKKDGMANIGGVLAVRDKLLAESCRNNLILTEGFPTYGGLSGRDLEAIAVGVFEALSEDYLRYRIRSTEYVGRRLMELGIPIVNPPGGHAIYVDAGRLLSHIPPEQFPGQSLVAKLYEVAGIRSCEIGSVMFGKPINPESTELNPPGRCHFQELVRLAIPRRTYTQSHMDYVIEAFEHLVPQVSKLRGVRFTHRPKVLRHFSARFEWV